MTQANKHCQEDKRFSVGEHVLLSTANLNLPKGRTCKLCPKYIGPYEILKVDHRMSTYKLKLLPDLVKRHVHDVFHENVLRPFKGNNETQFPKCKTLMHYDFGDDPEQEWVVQSIEDHKWSPNLQFMVRWEYGDAMWEPLGVVQELEALDQYLELQGVMEPPSLTRKIS